MNWDEQRRHPRFEVSEVGGSLLYSMDCRIVDISISGIKIESDRRLDIGREYRIRVAHGDDSFRVVGSVVWCVLTRVIDAEKSETVPVYRAGIEFNDILSEKAGELARFMRHNVVIHLEERLFGRFKFSPQEPANLGCEYDFAVKTLSLSGMMVETEILADVEAVFDLELRVRDQMILLRGRVAHVRQVGGEENRNLVQLGIEFADLMDDDREALERFINEELQL